MLELRCHLWLFSDIWPLWVFSVSDEKNIMREGGKNIDPISGKVNESDKKTNKTVSDGDEKKGKRHSWINVFYL